MKREKLLVQAYKELNQKFVSSIDWGKVEKSLTEFYNANK